MNNFLAKKAYLFHINKFLSYKYRAIVNPCTLSITEENNTESRYSFIWLIHYCHKKNKWLNLSP